jgi:hypothetical protein
MTAVKTCSEDGCDGKVHGRGLSGMHYRRWRLTVATVCSVEGCDGRGGTRGLCAMHYAARSISGTPWTVNTQPRTDSHAKNAYPAAQTAPAGAPRYAPEGC